MKRLTSQQIAGSLIALILIAIAIVYFMQKRNEAPLTLPLTTPNSQTITSKFPNITIPDDMASIELKDVGGGTSSGFASRKFENGKFELVAIVDLPDPDLGYYYQGWLISGNTQPYMPLGRLNLAKGGWILNYQSTIDRSTFNKVVISLEKGPVSTSPEKIILEGSF